MLTSCDQHYAGNIFFGIMLAGSCYWMALDGARVRCSLWPITRLSWLSLGGESLAGGTNCTFCGCWMQMSLVLWLAIGVPHYSCYWFGVKAA